MIIYSWSKNGLACPGLRGGCTLLDELSEGCEVSIYVYSKKLVPKREKIQKKNEGAQKC